MPFGEKTIQDFEEKRANVGVTAFWIAGMRAREYKRPGVPQDPYAAALMSEAGWRYFQEYFDHTLRNFYTLKFMHVITGLKLFLQKVFFLRRDPGWPELLVFMWRSFWEVFTSNEDFAFESVNRRIAFFDAVCLKAAEDGVRQCVIIGAGLDTRAFRLFSEQPEMHVIEVDHPDIFKYKEPRLKAIDATPCKRTIVPLEYDQVASSLRKTKILRRRRQ
mmetsp:Transcript_23642/g.46287  ORF Transcript_23642/g.46287 Transcript_23642/m.46287 type:complete len:218 (+) Transcript_23642:74-727(+)